MTLKQKVFGLFHFVAIIAAPSLADQGVVTLGGDEIGLLLRCVNTMNQPASVDRCIAAQQAAPIPFDFSPLVETTQSFKIRNANLNIVRECWDRTPEGASREVNYEAQYACKSSWGGLSKTISQMPAIYRLTRKKDGIHVGLNLRFRIESPSRLTPARANEMLSQARACVPRIQELWSRYGIRLDVSMDTAEKPLRAQVDHEIVLVDGVGRSRSGHYYYQEGFKDGVSDSTCEDECTVGQGGRAPICQRYCGEAYRQNGFCQTMTHEFGHLLGLEDEYFDIECPDRELVSDEQQPWSMMKERYHSWSQSEFFPRHLKTILAPLCGSRGAQ